MKIVKFKEKEEKTKENIKLTEELANFVDTFNLLTIINVFNRNLHAK